MTVIFFNLIVTTGCLTAIISYRNKFSSLTFAFFALIVVDKARHTFTFAAILCLVITTRAHARITFNSEFIATFTLA